MSANLCRLTGPADDGTPDGIGITFHANSFDSVDINAWDDEGNHVALTIDGDELAELRDALNALGPQTAAQ